MMNDFIEERIPKFYGSTTVGERGQVVIPVEARRDFRIAPADKLLVFGSPEGVGLILTKAETVTEFMTRITSLLTRFEEMLKADQE